VRSRPKKIKKPSARSVRREVRRAARLARRGPIFNPNGYVLSDYVSTVSSGASASAGPSLASFTNGAGASGAGGAATCSTWTHNAAATVAITDNQNWFNPRPHQIVIESLDDGRTWHTADNFEPAMNRAGQLLIGSTINGAAPEFMCPGSGTYRFEITMRGVTAEERAQWEADYSSRCHTLEAASLEMEGKLQSAAERARRLLLSHLSKRARADLESRRGFWVTSQFGNRYWVTRSTAVRCDQEGVALQRYCIHAVDPNVPPEDNALMRKLVLECNEELFLRTANPSPPSEWDLGIRPPAIQSANQQVTGQGQVSQGFTTGNGGNVRIVPAPVALFWVNGVVRALSG